jgi:hypothetical protein
VWLQSAVTTLGPVTTSTNGTAVIPKNNNVRDSPADYDINQYAASAQTADGQLIIVDLRPTSVAFTQGSSLQGEVILDRTVVGIGAALQYSAEVHSSLTDSLRYLQVHRHEQSRML